MSNVDDMGPDELRGGRRHAEGVDAAWRLERGLKCVLGLRPDQNVDGVRLFIVTAVRLGEWLQAYRFKGASQVSQAGRGIALVLLREADAPGRICVNDCLCCASQPASLKSWRMMDAKREPSPSLIAETMLTGHRTPLA